MDIKVEGNSADDEAVVEVSGDEIKEEHSSCENEEENSLIVWKLDAGDMNTCLDCARNQKGWKKVSAVQVPARESNTYQPSVLVASLMKYGFISYLKEMVTAPDSLMAYICHNYGLHRVHVFEAERFNDQLIHEEGLTQVLCWGKYQTVSGSKYSSAKTTMTKEVVGNSTMAMFMDTVTAAQLKHEIVERIVEFV